jgi:type II secretory ATPase GspE/PulE/Tfp pilus assembly ATPase PilB-like protein
VVIGSPEHSVLAVVDAILEKAISLHASDIHFEQTAHALRVRFRQDGVLVDEQPLSTEIAPQIIARLKVLSGLDSAERRIPQDGKLTFKMQKKTVDLRVSTFPSLHGEKIVVRILDRTVNVLDLSKLGFNKTLHEQFTSLLSQDNGFILVTGPTGSGKTTTLYAALNFLNTPEKNIVTLEDPVEYEFDNITQAQINPGTGFTFECGIRSVLRQDPDVLMVGEIRDRETARTAIQASLTGHLVLSTIHTNDAPGVIVRLIDMGVEPFLISASLVGVLSQRLVRLLCSNCAFKDEIRSPEVAFLQQYGPSPEFLYRAKGCVQCHQSGYKGRIGVFELLSVSSELRRLIIHDPHPATFYTQARKDGMQTIFADICEKLRQGLISFEELIRAGMVSI